MMFWPKIAVWPMKPIIAHIASLPLQVCKIARSCNKSELRVSC
jgi:hypothetical protein